MASFISLCPILNLSHIYLNLDNSPEYILAQELTRYYDEFALYYPAFKRLKAFTQITMLTRILNNIRENNEKTSEKLANILKQVKSWQQFIRIGGVMPRYTEDTCKKVYEEIQTEAANGVRNQFIEWRNKFTYTRIMAQREEQILNLKQKIGTLSFSQYSTEVNQICEQMIEDTCNKYQYQLDYDLTSQIKTQVEDQRSDIAEHLTKTKRNNIKQQLLEAFDEVLRSRLGWEQYESHIEALLNGDIQPLVKALADYDYDQALQQICKALLNAPMVQVKIALENKTDKLTQLADHVSDAQYRQFLSRQEQELQSRLQATTRLGANIRQLGLFQKSPEIDLNTGFALSNFTAEEVMDLKELAGDSCQKLKDLAIQPPCFSPSKLVSKNVALIKSNKAWRKFTGDNGSTPQTDLRRYDNWYDTECMSYLIHSQPTDRMLAFITNQSGGNSQSLLAELKELAQLRTLLQKPIGFIILEPSSMNTSHFIAGYLNLENRLLLECVVN